MAHKTHSTPSIPIFLTQCPPQALKIILLVSSCEDNVKTSTESPGGPGVAPENVRDVQTVNIAAHGFRWKTVILTGLRPAEDRGSFNEWDRLGTGLGTQTQVSIPRSWIFFNWIRIRTDMQWEGKFPYFLQLNSL